MSDPVSGTTVAAGGLMGAGMFSLTTGIVYGVVLGAFAGAVFYIATSSDLSATRRLAYFVVLYIAEMVFCDWLRHEITVAKYDTNLHPQVL
ncbi:MAG: putative holin [Hafnia sp.]